MVFGFDPTRALIEEVFLGGLVSNATVACTKTIIYVGFTLARQAATAIGLHRVRRMKVMSEPNGHDSD